MQNSSIFFRARLAAFSFALIGLAIFLGYYYSVNPRFLTFGVFFMAFAAIISGKLVSDCQDLAKRQPEVRNKARFHARILLLNLPLCGLLIISFAYLINYERITLVNDTGQPISELQLSAGANSKMVDRLAVGEQAEVWVPIDYDCSVVLEFQKEGKLNQETVIHYTSQDCGGKTRHFIGRTNPQNIR